MGVLSSILWFCRTDKTEKRLSFTQVDRLCQRFKLDDLRAATNNFDNNWIIGENGYCKVYRGCFHRIVGCSTYNVAIKWFKTTNPAWIKMKFQVEVGLLCQLRHPNIISLAGLADLEEHKFLVFEYSCKGSLHDYLQHVNNNTYEPLSWNKRLKICIGVARGLHYLHTGLKLPVIHRALNSGVILLDDNLVAKVADFVSSVKGENNVKKPPPLQVKEYLEAMPEYMDPEYFKGHMLTDKSDVYSFGVILLEVVCGKPALFFTPDKKYEPLTSWAFDDERRGNPSKIIDPFLRGKIGPECWKVFIEIAERCLVQEGHDRPYIGEVEVELERALELQERADASNQTGAQYILPRHETGNSKRCYEAGRFKAVVLEALLESS